MSGFNSIQLATAIRTGKRPEDVNSTEVKQTIADLGFTEQVDVTTKLSKEIRLVEKEIYLRKKDYLNDALAYQKTQSDLVKKFSDPLHANLRASQKDFAASARKTAQAFDSLLEKMKVPDRRPLSKYEDAIIKDTPTVGSKAQAAVNFLTRPNPFDSGMSFVDQTQPDANAGVFQLLEKFNDDFGAELIQFDKNNNITNLDELFDYRNSPLIRTGALTPAQVKRLADTETNVIREYQRNKDRIDATYTKLRDANDKIKFAATQLEAPAMTADQIMDINDGIADRLTSMQEIAMEGGGFDALDSDQLRDDVQQTKYLEKSRDRLYALMDAEEGEGPVQSRYQKTLAKIIGSDAYQAWAADHGFDELGRVDRDADGNIDPSTYVQGRDDLSSVRAFNREQKRGAGRYGFRSIGTGEIVRFELGGQQYIGERLKYHASDPPGAVRVMVGEGEPMLVMPGDVPHIDVIERRPDRVSPLARKATRRFQRMKGKIDAARRRASGDDPGYTGDAAITDDGSLITDAEGRYISAEEYDTMREEALAKGQVSGQLVDGVPYLTTGDERVFRLEPDAKAGGLNLVEVMQDGAEDGGQEYAKVFGIADKRRAGIPVYDKDGNLVEIKPVTAEDIASGRIDNFGLEMREGEEGYDPEDQARFDAVTEQQKLSVTPESLNLKVTTGEFDPMAGAPVDRETTINGMTMRYISDQPKSPARKAEEAKPPPRETPETDPPIGTDEEDIKETVEAEAQAKVDATATDAAKKAATAAAEDTPPTPAEEKPGEAVIPTAVADAPAGTTSLEASIAFRDQGPAALEAARAAATLGQPNAKELAQKYMNMAKAAGSEPEPITMFDDKEREAYKLKLAGQRTQSSDQSKRQELVKAFKETGLDDSKPPPPAPPATTTPPVVAPKSTDDPSSDAQKPVTATAPGQGGPPRGNPVDMGGSPDELKKRLEENRRIREAAKQRAAAQEGSSAGGTP